MDASDAEKSFCEILRAVLERLEESGRIIQQVYNNLQKVAGSDALAIWQSMNSATEDTKEFCRMYRVVYGALRKGIAPHDMLDWLTLCKQDATYSIVCACGEFTLMHGMNVWR